MCPVHSLHPYQGQVMAQSLWIPWCPNIMAGLEMEVGRCKTDRSPRESVSFSFPNATLNSPFSYPPLLSATLESVDCLEATDVTLVFINSLKMDFKHGMEDSLGLNGSHNPTPCLA